LPQQKLFNGQWKIHTTKENISGGIGLALFKEFIELNRGEMQIVSDKPDNQNRSKKDEGRFFKTIQR
jgi:light-regulated signal transduction histidine kinase (bacteriophytochrome)